MSSWIDDLKLTISSEIKNNESIKCNISFRVEGKVREVFNQDVWTRAYEQHDKLFRIKYTLILDNKDPITLIRKASFYWSRDPHLKPYPPEKKIWVMIVKDNFPFIPSSVEEARSLLFNVSCSITLVSSQLKDKELNLEVKASWGKHTFIEAGEVSAKTVKKV